MRTAIRYVVPRRLLSGASSTNEKGKSVVVSIKGEPNVEKLRRELPKLRSERQRLVLEREKAISDFSVATTNLTKYMKGEYPANVSPSWFTPAGARVAGAFIGVGLFYWTLPNRK